MSDIPDWKRQHYKWILENHDLPKGAIRANLDKQAPNNSYDVKAYYVDQPFTCVDCRKKEVWTARQQQWWYKIAQGPIQL